MDYLSFCESVLGPGVRSSGDDYVFKCPGCGQDKLSINIDRGIYRCWVCGGSSDKRTSFSRKIQQARDGKWFGTGYIKLIASYFKVESMLGEGEVYTPSKREVLKEDSFSLTKFRLVLSKLFEEGSSLVEDHKAYLYERGFSPLYWERRGYTLSISDNPIDAYSSSLAYKKLKEWLSPKERQELHITNEEGVLESWIRPGKILIPYREHFSGPVLGVRSRSTLSVAKIKYIWPRGMKSGRLVYGLDTISENTDTVLITEGELKSALAVLFGVPCIAIPGINSSHETCVEALSRRKIRRAVLCFDTENTHVIKDGVVLSRAKVIEAVEQACRHLSWLLKNSGIDVSRMHLPESSTKTDIDSFILAEGPEKFIELWEKIKSG